ncbi:MAG: hypothetical protein A3H25_02830 [Sphingomonadales bacterium RIFCSPLOWO2_12_FULL_63_15]|nr:MAG: hypothetical protein A3H25_02830 [Sphingomonadales bacterium RIFCSPLOWO2_12_FULL_63_15]
MIFDNTLLFSDAQAITAGAGSTNTVDLGATGTPYGGVALVRDIGKGSKIPLSITVVETFNNLTSLAVSLQVDDNSSFSSAKTVVVSAPILAAALVAGAQIEVPDYIPQGANERYMRLYYDVTGVAPTTGKITAGVVAARQTNFVGGQ